MITERTIQYYTIYNKNTSLMLSCLFSLNVLSRGLFCPQKWKDRTKVTFWPKPSYWGQTFLSTMGAAVPILCLPCGGTTKLLESLELPTLFDYSHKQLPTSSTNPPGALLICHVVECHNYLSLFNYNTSLWRSVNLLWCFTATPTYF